MDYLKGLKEGKRLMTELEGSIQKTYLIDGKTPLDWQQEFKLAIPKGATPAEIRDANARLIDLFNVATFYIANAQLINDAIEQGAHDTYIFKFEAKVQEYQQADKKLPAKDTLKTLAETGMSELTGASANAAMKLRFWKHIMSGLSEQRKSLEQIMWMLREEMRSHGDMT